MEIRDRSFVITGGASGLGAAVARLLYSKGAGVIIADLDQDNGVVVAKELKGIFIKTDVTDEESVKNLFSEATKEGRKVHGLINCAGIAIAEKVVGKNGVHSLQSFSKVIGINLIGTFNAIRIFSQYATMNNPNSDGERGVIVNTSSIAAFEGQIGQAAYSASKGGIVGMTLPIARDLAAYGIRVVTIAPGIFDTPLLGKLPPDVRETLGKQVPFPSRLGRPEEFAALAVHIIENAMINGETIRLDGAIRMPPR
ncbi:MAG: 3-hydroxyacyl-CoA dehydrogenase [Candidatus Thermoplasmatota archaeon]|nr:3-hydroxyacyl-CoA dehydrogenase [Candidatus Thermoplasmatota archaeon]